ncbi:MAG: hypothetical protein WKI04_14290 [Ferruginibacter sp.]
MDKIKKSKLEKGNFESLNIGDKENPGSLFVNIKGNEDQYGISQTVAALSYSADTGTLTVGDAYAASPAAKIIVHKEGSKEGIVLNGNGSIYLGGTGDGEIHLKTKMGQESIFIDGKNANITLGGVTSVTDGAVDGDIIIKNGTGDTTIVLDGSNGSIVLGGGGAAGVNGDISLKNDKNIETVKIDGGNGNIILGGAGDIDGDITIKNTTGNDVIVLSGNGDIFVGGIGSNGDIVVKNSNDVETIKIKGSSGDIEFLNADFAEDFDIEEAVIARAVPGTVMTLNDKGKLVPCHKNYDSKVIGVIAGAGKYKPGIVMDKSGAPNRLPVAIMGKVYCKVDARKEPIKTGDLITTSETEGYAMKAADRTQAFGTVIGKALQPAAGGVSIIPILVNLQ